MADSFESRSSLPPEVHEHYASGYESQRLLAGASQIELVRTQELIVRYAPPPPAVMFDVGGGPGVYACWLARQGYEVHLIDAHPLHVELARQASQAQPDTPLAGIEVGDARHLNRADTSVDVVLLFGPLYHLTQRADRLMALREAQRILRPGGLLFGAAISRFASVLDGLRQGLLADPAFVQIVERDLTDGQHRKPMNHPAYFTTAFFHDPKELEVEVQESGFLYRKNVADRRAIVAVPRCGSELPRPEEARTVSDTRSSARAGAIAAWSQRPSPGHCTQRRTTMNALPEGLAKWHRFVNEKDMQALSEALADDVLFRSPVLWKPKEGRAMAMLYLSSAVRVLEDFTYQRQFVGENAVVLEFSAHVGALSVKGVDIIQFNTAGQITDFEVMIRSANGLQALGVAMAQQLASADPPKIES